MACFANLGSASTTPAGDFERNNESACALPLTS